MRLLTVEHVPSDRGDFQDHVVTVDRESGSSGKVVYTMRVDAVPERSFDDAKAAVRAALSKVFPA